MFNCATPITAWYLGLIDGSGTPTLAAGDTYAQIGGTNGWNENVNYYGDDSPGVGQRLVHRPVRHQRHGGGLQHQWLGQRLWPVPGRRRHGPQHEERPQRRRDAVGRRPVLFGTVTVANGDQLKVTYTVSC